LPQPVAAQISDILRDRTARAPSFGERSALELPFEVAVKTGTSKGFRDNYTVGYTDRFTVAVWVGNFDGSAMQGVSGVTGAAPLFRGIMLAAMRGHEDEPLRAAVSDELEDVEVCALSGGLPTSACGARAHERLPASARRDMCSMHKKVAIDSRNGLLAGEGCPRGFVSERVVESYPDELVAWAKAAGRPIAPVDVSPHCPDGRARAGAAVRILSPRDGAHFVTDPDRPLSHQTVPVTVSGEAGARVRLRVDGRAGPLVRVGDPLSFRLAPGKHELVIEVEGGAESAPVHVDVD
jgi:penicillin-binding protein 1C